MTTKNPLMTEDTPEEYRLPIPSDINDLAYIALKTLRQLEGRERIKFQAMTARTTVIRPAANAMREMLLQIGLHYVLAIEAVELKRKENIQKCQQHDDEKSAGIVDDE